MESTLNKELLALKTTELVATGLKKSADREEVIDRLIRAIEDDRAVLLASILHARASNRPPVRTRRPVS